MTTLAPLQMGTLLHALPPQPQGFAAVNDDEFPALGTERKVARTVHPRRFDGVTGLADVAIPPLLPD